MANQVLNRLIIEATSIDVGRGPWLLEASALSEAIYDAVLGDPRNLENVRQAVRETAARAGCDLIVGASPSADRVVRDLNVQGGEPSRALLFELVRVTGAAFASARQELRHVDVVPAVFVDVNPSTRPSDVLAVGAVST
ncbi:MAG: hypothetical protein F4Z00_02455 [Acidimicrobiaceae bacterium]|nr:hypothetical protein [Acidimicrobiaceae bacterium]MXZ64393.1 hypothetical protein [Acidimicrobiaceae bacterium]MYF33850.1 hypothetical protein [Acidimicrobiaceae bacterium]MYG76805.1 hypothetical protein [Acidimicrobiaceae bacterium]MYJ84151.1 hypothetical protein [Acidimicrobiaceae bacterium]